MEYQAATLSLLIACTFLGGWVLQLRRSQKEEDSVLRTHPCEISLKKLSERLAREAERAQIKKLATSL